MFNNNQGENIIEEKEDEIPSILYNRDIRLNNS